MNLSDWKPKRLDELGFVGRGKSRNRPRNAPELYGGQYPFIQTADISNSDLYITTYSQTYSELGLAQSKMWDANTLCIVNAGVNTGDCSILKFRACFPDSVIGFVADPRKADVRFVKYYLDTITEEIRHITMGATQDNLSVSKLLSFKIPTPPLDIQRKTMAVLSAYDDLIENNTRRIAILEEMAQTLYREWFVHFRFPGHEDVALVDVGVNGGNGGNGRVPEGWGVTKLGKYLKKLETGKRPKGGVSKYTDGVPSIGAENVDGIGKHDFSKEKYVPAEFFQSMNKGHIQDGDVAIYKDGAYIGKSAYFRGGFPHIECCVNEHVFLLRSEERRLTQNYLYLWLQDETTLRAIRATNANAAQPGINQTGVKNLQIVIPDTQLAAKFDMLVDPILASIINLAKRNNVLSQTRDLLLPRLISGELDVSQLDIAT